MRYFFRTPDGGRELRELTNIVDKDYEELFDGLMDTMFNGIE